MNLCSLISLFQFPLPPRTTHSDAHAGGGKLLGRGGCEREGEGEGEAGGVGVPRGSLTCS